MNSSGNRRPNGQGIDFGLASVAGLVVVAGITALTGVLTGFRYGDVAAAAVALLAIVGGSVWLVRGLRKARERPPAMAPVSGDGRVRAYVALEVTPPLSREVVIALTSSDTRPELAGILYVSAAAAVWGDWDVICEVNAPDHSTFQEALNAIQSQTGVERTETLLVREATPSRFRAARQPRSEHAFVFLRVAAPVEDSVIQAIGGAPELHDQLLELERVYGRYDIVLKLQCAIWIPEQRSDGPTLRELVLEDIQGKILAASAPRSPTHTAIVIEDIERSR